MDSLEGNDAFINAQQGTLSLLESGSVKAIRIAQFLTKEERDALFSAVCQEQEAFKTFELPGTQAGPTRFYTPTNEAGPIDMAHKRFSIRVIEWLPYLLETLGVEPFEVSDIPINLAHGQDGHWGDPHADSTNGRYKISILYYFHQVPKMFKGGDLEFYSTDEQAPNGHSEQPIFSIEMQDNMFVAFPSQTFHGVTKVQSTSKDFANGRFVAVGFIG